MIFSRRSIRLCLVIGVVAATVVWWFFTPPSIDRTSGEMTQDAYVWQRRWDVSVLTAIDEHAAVFGSIVPLAAEVEWLGGRGRVVEVPVDFSALARARHANGTAVQIGAALRIGPYKGPFVADDAVGSQLCDIARSIVHRAAEAGVSLSELQIDFDAASSKLAGYRVWVEAIAAAISPTPVVITTLPTWMSHDDFDDLVAASAAFVLQVHSIERPLGPNAKITLCDAKLTRKWVDRAAQFGRPFRVALPTYGYLVAFDSAGKFIGLSAEGPGRDWPRDAMIRRVDADPAAMASLIDEWRRNRPMLMKGVIWYRLPTRSDTLNWGWPTLATVMEGRLPVPRAGAVVRRVEPGLIEIDLTNSGDGDAPARQSVRLSWANARLIAGDGAMGYTLERTNDTTAKVLPTAAALRLRRIGSGDTLTVAWLRFDHDTEVTVDVFEPD